jgi:hypothetical protein
MPKRLLPGRILFAAALVLLCAASCRVPPADPGPPSIRGLVKGLSESRSDLDITGFIQVESGPEEDTLYDRALVAVTRKTAFFRVEGGAKTRAAFADLGPGMLVEVWFTGPVAESYPVQATAKTVVILAR